MLLRDENFYMQQALREAEMAGDKKEVPIGCVIVKDGQIIGRGHNGVEGLKDPTAHAEIIAIGSACDAVDNWRLEGCELYVTLEPCPMCAGAILNSRIAKVIYAAPDKRLGACGSTMDILSGNPINRVVDVHGGILESEALYLIQEFFRGVRERKK
ncbi:MAG: tRNA adenosine(34) deaminase TadA [Fibrobacterales bacterium]